MSRVNIIITKVKTFRSLGYGRVYLPFDKGADTPSTRGRGSVI